MAEIEERQLYWLVNTKEGYEYYKADYVTPGEDGHLYIQRVVRMDGGYTGREALAVVHKDFWLGYRQVTEKAYAECEDAEEYV